jgi:hypothetical protein
MREFAAIAAGVASKTSAVEQRRDVLRTRERKTAKKPQAQLEG